MTFNSKQGGGDGFQGRDSVSLDPMSYSTGTVCPTVGTDYIVNLYHPWASILPYCTVVQVQLYTSRYTLLYHRFAFPFGEQVSWAPNHQWQCSTTTLHRLVV